MRKIIFAISVLAMSAQAFAAGLEKEIMFGGQTSGVAGIGSPYVSGSQALYFNPAGLVEDKVGSDVSFNVSPTWPTFKSQVASTNSTTYTSKSVTFMPFGLMYGHTVNDSLGWGVGVYVSGGVQGEYNDVRILNQGPFTTKSNMSITELAAGVGYKLNDWIKVGGAYRVSMVNAEFSSEVVPTSGALAGKVIESDYTGLKDNNFVGYKLGAQFKISEKSKLGLVYRSEVNFSAKGSYSRHAPAVGTLADASGDASIGTVFPAALNLGYEHVCSETWKTYAEIVWAQYSKVTNLAINQTSGTAQGAFTSELQDTDQTSLRLAGAYSGWNWPVRVGVAWTSAVANADHALPTATPPGPLYTTTLGTGQAWGNWRADGGLEYSWGSGTPTNFANDNTVSVYALHLGTSYSF